MNTSLSKRLLNEKYPSPLPTSLKVESFSNKDSETGSDALSKKSFENNNHENSSADVQEKEKGKNEIVDGGVVRVRQKLGGSAASAHGNNDAREDGSAEEGSDKLNIVYSNNNKPIDT